VKKYFFDEEISRIDLFDERFYHIKVDGKEYDIFNVTGWLDAFPKGNGFKTWLMNTKDPDAVRDEAAQLGSGVHDLIERTLKGETVEWIEGVSRLDVWERYLCWCKFWKDLQNEPNKVLGIKKPIKSVSVLPHLTEFIVFDTAINAAGTVDKLLGITYEDDSTQQILLDWKSGNNIYDTAYIQVSTYIKMTCKKYKLKDILGFIIQINPSLNKKGYRVHPVENIEEEYEMFLTTQKLYIRAFGQPKPKYKSYPAKVNLEFIKQNQIIKEV
jgi:hypothetical protein